MVQYILTFKLTDGHQYFHYQSPIPITLKCQYHTAKHYGLVGFVRQKKTLEPIFVN